MKGTDFTMMYMLYGGKHVSAILNFATLKSISCREVSYYHFHNPIFKILALNP